MPLLRLAALPGSLLAASVAYAGCLSAPGAAPDAVAPVTARGCTPDGGPAPVTAPGGYYTSGGTVCTATGEPHLFHGVDRPSLEFCPDSTNAGCTHFSADDFTLMASWKANVVRVALDQDRWLATAALYDPNYASTVEQVVQWAEAVGLDVILDLHWSDLGDLGVATSDFRGGAGNSGQQPMADVNSLEFWREVAALFKDDGHVLFELYNEPHNITWDVWLHGGPAGGFTAVGMQQLYDAVRATGANNVVIAGGNSWAYDLSAVGPNAVHVDGYNVMYATHPYLASGDAPSGWENSFGRLETSDFAPVIATEFGDSTTPNCKGDWNRQVIQFADAHGMSWTAWAWWVDYQDTDTQGCGFPAIIVNWGGDPSVQGIPVKAALAAYAPSPGGALDASGGPPDQAGSSEASAGDESQPADEAAEGGSDDAPSEASVAPSE